jgi:hypothetical protein
MVVEYTYDEISFGDGDSIVFLIRLANDSDPFEDRFDTIKEVGKALEDNLNSNIYFSSELLMDILNI